MLRTTSMKRAPLGNISNTPSKRQRLTDGASDVYKGKAVHQMRPDDPPEEPASSMESSQSTSVPSRQASRAVSSRSPARVQTAASQLKVRLGMAMYKVRARRTDVPYRSLSIPLHMMQRSQLDEENIVSVSRSASDLPLSETRTSFLTTQASFAWSESTESDAASGTSSSIKSPLQLASTRMRVQANAATEDTTKGNVSHPEGHRRRGSDPTPILPPIHSIVASGLLQRM
ncbi:hypothetical protein PYCC9005_002899 [Savitreella phatthalungensis]